MYVRTDTALTNIIGGREQYWGRGKRIDNIHLQKRNWTRCIPHRMGNFPSAFATAAAVGPILRGPFHFLFLQFMISYFLLFWHSSLPSPPPYPTDPFAKLEPQNVLKLRKIGWSPDLWAPKLWNGQSGSPFLSFLFLCVSQSTAPNFESF